MKWQSEPIGARPYAILPFDLPSFLANCTVPELLAWITGPVCILKNVINLVQLWKASKMLVGVDLAERQAAREASQNKRR